MNSIYWPDLVIYWPVLALYEIFDLLNEKLPLNNWNNGKWLKSSNTQKLEFPRTTVHNLTLLTSDGNLLTRFDDKWIIWNFENAPRYH